MNARTALDESFSFIPFRSSHSPGLGPTAGSWDSRRALPSAPTGQHTCVEPSSGIFLGLEAVDYSAQVAEASGPGHAAGTPVDIGGEGKRPCHARLRARLIPEAAEQPGLQLRSFLWGMESPLYERQFSVGGSWERGGSQGGHRLSPSPVGPF